MNFTVFLVLGLMAVMPCNASRQSPSESAMLVQLLDAYHEIGLFHGVAIVARGEKVLIGHSTGQANYDWDVPNTLNGRFALGSVSKLFEALIALDLVDRGLLDLDAPLAERLPWLGSHPAAKVTLRQLLAHTSGVPDYLNDATDPDAINYRSWSARELVAKALDRPLEFDPGAGFEYSNTGYLLIKLLIEAVIDDDYCDVLRKRILDPVGMTQTGCMDRTEILEQRVSGFERASAELRRTVELANGIAEGLLYSTAPDLLRLGQALNEGKHFSPGVLELLRTPSSVDTWLSEDQGGRHENGLGVEIFDLAQFVPGGKRLMYTNGGGLPGFSAVFHRVPQDQLVVIVLNNVRARPIYPEIFAVLHGLPYEMPKGEGRWPVRESGGPDQR